MILLSDANVLMDLGYVGGLRLLPLLGRCEVLTTVLLECMHELQPGLMQQILAAGIVPVEVEQPLVESAVNHPNEILSLSDRQCLIYAQQAGRILLTGDRFLRAEAEGLGVTCHGSVWLVEQAWRLGGFSRGELCGWLSTWPLQKRRLPRAELQRLKHLIGCP
ncbi:putative nucleic acid-binding protein [Deinococcus metalli]|uniref:Putative nucleic acid-binding protein n=1 Tax=Deinococcus metalli TaxID=1141878 RepID=A0A7W8KIW0_9DEIO|nr:hypothetical protein [Deinococcus metalli]MBB5378985.1 putative nucleic acid-binding protein [Deinococcus metalli]GHF63583.1 hypothetical protein GCM10017781_44410 [Deinococcus metalli]